jgi:flavorubredoxin
MAGPVSRSTIAGMETTVHEIADGFYRLSTYLPDITPAGFTMNQFLVDAEEPLLFHCGPRALFPLVSEAVSRVLPVERLRWITFGHVEADECGSMNQWLAAAPSAQVAHGALGCMVSIADMADRPPRPLAEGEVLDIGGHRLRQISTPHVPHAWEAQVLFDESTKTLLCGDLFTQVGTGSALVHDADMVTPALAAEDMFHATCVTPSTAPTMRELANLDPRTLALMHGPSFTGDCAAALRDLADGYADRLTLATAAPGV